jgi:hydrogenase maturation protein HypF
MLTKKINCPLTSSVGRLFDGVAAILGLRYQLSFEGQAAMELEFALEEIKTDEYYPFSLFPDQPIVIDWNQIILGVIEDREKEIEIGIIAAKFHNSLSEIIVRIAQGIGTEKILLTGGCFQNRYLTERTINRLRASGFQPYWQQIVPTNDGGISLGQIIGAFDNFSPVT